MPQLAQAPGQIRTLLRVLRQSLKQLREETIRCKGVTHNAHSPGFTFGVVCRSGTIGRQDLNTCGSFVDNRRSVTKYSRILRCVFAPRVRLGVG